MLEPASRWKFFLAQEREGQAQTNFIQYILCDHTVVPASNISQIATVQNQITKHMTKTESIVAHSRGRRLEVTDVCLSNLATRSKYVGNLGLSHIRIIL